jgi:Spy/CpxP family protein refolding chaperone
MNSSLRWKLILAFALVFIAGGACGFFAAMHSPAWMQFHHPPPGSLAQHMKDHLAHELKLTQQQADQIAPIVDRATSQLEAKREQSSREIRAIFQQLHTDISPILTPEQRDRLARMEQRHRQMMRRRGLRPPPEPPPQ